jgi:mono/diheme cytochrome c family protein
MQNDRDGDGKGGRMKSFVLAVLILLVLGVVGGGLFAFSGFYDVSADVPHWRLTFLILDEARDRSIEFHSDGITAPPLDEKLADIGFHHFHETCRLCHGAPGYDRGAFAAGLYPSPPDLCTAAFRDEATDAKLYWVVKHGLKMTGMPSFGLTNDEETLWGIVAFARQLPELTPEDYASMVRKMGHDKSSPTSPEPTQNDDHDRGLS